MRHNGVLMATPLLMVLIVIETTDLVFAVDSIPAIFSVTPIQRHRAVEAGAAAGVAGRAGQHF